jgi:hypothetical protein
VSAFTVEVPDELAARLRSHQKQLTQILERGLRQVESVARSGYVDATEVLEFLARLPQPEEILALHASASLQRRVEELSEKQREGTLTAEEASELDHYLYVDRLVRLAKAHAQRRAKTSASD